MSNAETYRLPEGMAALSDFQKKKLEHLYNLFYESRNPVKEEIDIQTFENDPFSMMILDVNKDGKVDWADFECSLETVAKINGWEKDGEKMASAKESLKMIWDGLKGKADKNSDGIVSHDEWLTMWGECAEAIITKQEFPYWLSAYMGFMFEAADTSADNVIDKEEYRKAYTGFGLPAEQCDKAYDSFTNNGAIALNRELYSKLWHEFFLSDDQAAKGNALFGQTEW